VLCVCCLRLVAVRVCFADAFLSIPRTVAVLEAASVCVRVMVRRYAGVRVESAIG